MKLIAAAFLVLLVGVNSRPDENHFSFDQTFDDTLNIVKDILNPNDKDVDDLFNGWIDKVQETVTNFANNEHVEEFAKNIKSKFQDDGEFKQLVNDLGNQLNEGINKFVEQMENESENSDAFDQWKNQFTKPGQKEELNQFEEQLKEAWQQNSENGSECILKSA